MLNLNEYLKVCAESYDPQLCMVGVVHRNPGYHTRIPDGAIVHPTRDAADYVLALLAEGSAANVERAHAVLDRLLTLQETDSYRPTFGIWSWYYEEPLDRMSPPDWNWADFIGARLAHMLRDYGDRLTPELAARTGRALEFAAWSIFRRNVQPDYTNIAIMGAAVTAAAAEFREIPFLLDYARRRLRAFLTHTLNTGGLNEYNSPTYTFVALEEAERMLQLVTDPEIRQDAEKLRRFVWGELAAFFHPATGQLCPPNSRTYADTLSGESLDVLRQGTGLALPGPVGRPVFSPIRKLPCPAELIPRFAALPTPEVTVERVFIRKETERASTRGYAFLTPETAFGSASHDSLWVQRRPLSAYWVNPEDPDLPCVFNTDGWKDGREFASLGLESVQCGNRVLSHLVAYTNRGDYHLHFNHPGDDIWHFRELAMSWELTGPGAAIEALGDRLYRLRAGNWQMAVEVAPAEFLGRPVTLETVSEPGRVVLKAVLYRGPETAVRFDERLALSLPFALELAPAGSPVVSKPFEISVSGQDERISRDGLTLMGSHYATICE